MDVKAAFLQADTRNRLTMVRADANKTALVALLGEQAFAELRSVSNKWFDGVDHLAPEEPKNVIFVPGIMGSLLMNRRLAGIWWIDVRTRNFIDHLGLTPDGTKDADSANDIAPATADPSYTPFLAAASVQKGLNHEIFAYDWRKSLVHSASALRDLVLNLYRDNGGRKVHLVAHSMGGLMVRTALMRHGEEMWPKIGKIVFVGTPHYGSAAIAGYLKNHLWGFEVMAVLGAYLKPTTLRSLWGVLSLLPAPRGVYPGTRANEPTWQPDDPADPYVHPCANFDLYHAQDWKLDLDAKPTARLQTILDATADHYRNMYDAHRALDQERRDQMISIVGVGYQTLFRLAYAPGFFGLWEKTAKTFNRVDNNPHRDGDGRVPAASALLENVGDIRFVQGVHGSLTNIPAVYEDVFRCLKDETMCLPKTIAGALSEHLAETPKSEAPNLDGSSGVSIASDDPGLWQVDKPTDTRMQELDAMLAADRLPDFGRIHLL